MKKVYSLTNSRDGVAVGDENESGEQRLRLPEGTTVIVTGAQGALAQEYLRSFSELTQGETQRVIGLHRRTLTGEELVSSDDVTYVQVDLSDREITEKVLSALKIEECKRLIVVNTIGKFKAEFKGEPEIDVDGDGIDDEIKLSNVGVAENITSFLEGELAKHKELQCEFINFGSVVENEYSRHSAKLQHIKSYCLAKQEMEATVQEASRKDGRFSAAIFRLPTLDTEQEHRLRPYAEYTQDWISPRVIVSRTLSEIIERNTLDSNDRYLEVDIYPKDFTEAERSAYIEQHLERWLREAGLNRSEGSEANLEFSGMKKL